MLGRGVTGDGHALGPRSRARRAIAWTGARRAIAWTGVAVMVGVLTVPADGVAQERPSEQIERELEDTTAEAGELEVDLDEVRGSISEAEEALAAIGARLADARARLQLADGQVALGEQALIDAQDIARAASDDHRQAVIELQDAEAALAAEEEVFTLQLVHAFKYGTTGAQRGAMVLEVMRRADDPNAFAVGLKQLQIVVDEQDATVQRFFALRDTRGARALDAAEAETRSRAAAAAAEEALEHLADLREDAAAVASEVEVEEAAQRELLDSLRTTADETEALFVRIADRQAELEQELNEQRAREEARRLAAEEEARRRAAEEAAREQAAEQEARRRAEESRDDPPVDADSGSDADRGDDGTDPVVDDGHRAPDPGRGGGPPVDGLVCPVVGAVAGRDFSNDWGVPRSGGRTHEGNDIFAAAGTPVVAVQDAVILRWNPPSSPTGLGGITVTYRTSDGSEWYNAHLDSVAPGIEPGVHVARGEEIGTVGNSGNAAGTPPHLHLGRRHGGGWVNPWPTISAVCR